MYGLKEKTIGKLLVKLLKLNPNSEDGFNLLNWKLPGQTTASRMAGDFAGRCYEVLSKRAMRSTVGDMRIAEVNELLDRLSVVGKEEDQLPIFQNFYTRMNAEELMWLIRIILRQMKIGASEKTIFEASTIVQFLGGY
jgi:DNA ligase-4